MPSPLAMKAMQEKTSLPTATTSSEVPNKQSEDAKKVSSVATNAVKSTASSVASSSSSSIKNRRVTFKDQLGEKNPELSEEAKEGTAKVHDEIFSLLGKAQNSTPKPVQSKEIPKPAQSEEKKPKQTFVFRASGLSGGRINHGQVNNSGNFKL